VSCFVHDTQTRAHRGDFRPGPGAAGATIAHYRSDGLKLVSGPWPAGGLLPGTFESWMLLLRDYGHVAAARRIGNPPRLLPRRLPAWSIGPRRRCDSRTNVPEYLDPRRPRSTCLITKCQSPARSSHKTLSEPMPASSRMPQAPQRPHTAQIERARKAVVARFCGGAIGKFCRTQE